MSKALTKGDTMKELEKTIIVNKFREIYKNKQSQKTEQQSVLNSFKAA